MSTPSIPHPIRAAELGEPQRRYLIVPRELPVPAPPAQEEPARPTPAPAQEPEPVR